ncbi:APC family permease [Methanococcoides alaskense]|uniref:Amino acid transporter n=1 Tax=Methanococcoides alaskense TaxID=325778 RepID=A0AA90Z7J5_9EURY|nr:APC family permease [Methanococcoides alaskense]MDR6222665.1 amino acid transporter [Methanococcoides alaskense]
MTESKSIGLWQATSIGVGAMIGAGIFSIFGVATQISGDAVYISFIIAGMVALLSTYSYAKLGARYPSAGGPAEFLIRGFGDGILSGGLNILLWIGYIFGLALYAKGFSLYAMTFLPAGSPEIWSNIFATAIILIFTAINFIGAKAVGRSEIFIVSIKVGILILFALAGLFFIDPVRLSLSHWPQTSNIFYGAGIVFLSYQGFGLITNAAEDMSNPEETLPKALYLSVIIVICIYVLVSLAVVGNLSITEIVESKEYALAAAAQPFLGIIGFKIMAIAALFSTSSAINASLYGGANVSYMLAKEGELPIFFERKVWKRSTEGLFITAGLVILCTNLLNLEGIGMMTSASLLVIYVAVNTAHLRLSGETGAKPYLIWASLFSSLIFFGILVYYELIHSIITLIVFAVILTLCFIVEWAYRKYSRRILKTRTLI